jgi:cold shock CspA family protein
MTTEANKRVTGKIIGIVEGKGYGFIASPEVQFERIFFHWSALVHKTKRFSDLKKGDKVEFTPVKFTDKNTGEDQGYRALRIEVIEEKADDTNRKVS